MNAYEEKKQLRIERLERAARMCAAQAERMNGSARQMASVIPMGQPILVGHYSESRDRNYRARIQRRFEKAAELSDKAARYAAAAANARSNRTISSDDPDAPEKIQERIQKAEALQAKFKAINAAIRKKDDAALAALGLSPEQIAKLKQPDFCGRIGIPDYQLKNNNANIRRMKERVLELERRASQKTAEITKAGIRMVDNVEENRLQLFFPGKPDPEILKVLKSGGFRWTPSVGCWQQYRSCSAKWRAEKVMELAEKGGAGGTC